MPHDQLPRGIRNNNPGNIRRSPTRWEGQAESQTDPSFVVFVSPQYGIRALARILLNYQSQYHLSSLEEMIHRWAPPNENDTEAYIRAVAMASDVDAKAAIILRGNKALFARIVTAIIDHENGSAHGFGRDRWYDPAIVEQGIVMALA
jgi:hypothetical protein